MAADKIDVLPNSLVKIIITES